ncbi:type VII secretion-associated protein [Corynebacterium sp.]|uniref:type VII secretion-associated protein n=1 Tax=Corynebacterium sp. TaxID=1720 RepID=UPI0025B87206|nr:type VII secretion-associated protein [Corynebacterium sp.]
MNATGMTVQAVSLVESGILVNGWTVTDLLSGFSVRCDAPGDSTGLLWRGSTVPLSKLEAVRELVAEALEERAADPDLTDPNPRTPRVRFPWGVGESTTDVLVTGENAATVAAYLRTVGVRARCVDPDTALRLAADLEMARAELAELEGGELEEEPEQELVDAETDAERPPVRQALLAVTAVVVVLVGVLAVAGILRRGGDESVAAALPTGATSNVVPTPEQESVAAAPTDDALFADPVRRGDATPEHITERADIPVNADLDGWTLREATDRREIWMSDDPDARILVAATPTPLGTQEELDARLLTGLADMPAAKVTSQHPVDYAEDSGRSTTRWQVRLIDGHQVSVGCQYRAGTAEETAGRLAACDRFTATARVG